MTSDKEMGMAVMTAVLLAVIICLLSMCSCSGRKVITETIVTHDTIHITHSDTVSIDRWLTHHDTLRIETEKVITLVRDTVGMVDTVKVENSTFHWQHIADANTETRFVSKVDSILRAMDARHDKETNKTKVPLEYWLYGGFLLVCGFGCIWLLANTKKDS